MKIKRMDDKLLDDEKTITCCPVCSKEEFLISEDRDVLICIDCGSVPINSTSSKNAPVTRSHPLPTKKHISLLH